MEIKKVDKMKLSMKLLSKSLMLLLLAAAFVLPVNAALQAAGPISTVHGFPVFYQDTTGLALQPCLGLNPDGTGLADPNCVLLADATFNPALAVSFPDNFPAEFFYYIADADTPKIGPAQVSLAFLLALEGSFATGAPLVNDQIVFLRVNMRVSQVGGTHGLVPSSTYTVTHPFGTFTCVTDALGDITSCTDPNGNGGGGVLAYRVEDGAFVPPLTPITAASFLPAPLTQIGPFLKAVSPSPPAGYIGNPVIPQTIQPGPNGAALRIAGPSIDPLNADGDGNANLLVINNWFVAGKIAVIDTIPPVIGATSPAQVTVGAVNIPATVSVTDDQFVGSVTIDIGPIGNDFSATINGTNAGTPSAATGSGTFTIDTSANTLSFNINVAGLTSTETAAHIHVPTQPAFNLPLGASKVGVWTYPEAFEPDILAGNAFVQVHTTLFPAGEIAGPIRLTPNVQNMVPISCAPGTETSRTNCVWGVVIPSATRAGTFNLPLTVSDGSNSVTGNFVLTVVQDVFSISGMKFNDLNANGIKEAREPGVANWTITLAQPNGIHKSTLTDSDGNYIFQDLPTGSYTLMEEVKAGWIQTFPQGGIHTVTLAGEDITGINFGNFKKGKITGKGFIQDSNGKAIFGLAGFYPDNSNGASGIVVFNDSSARLSIRSVKINTVATTTDRKNGVITGLARVNGEGSFYFEVHVEDNGEPGKDTDKFGIILPAFQYSNGGVLRAGNIRIYE